jgi:hypothetical protein
MLHGHVNLLSTYILGIYMDQSFVLIQDVVIEYTQEDDGLKLGKGLSLSPIGFLQDRL